MRIYGIALVLVLLCVVPWYLNTVIIRYGYGVALNVTYITVVLYYVLIGAFPILMIIILYIIYINIQLFEYTCKV